MSGCVAGVSTDDIMTGVYSRYMRDIRRVCEGRPFTDQCGLNLTPHGTEEDGRQ